VNGLLRGSLALLVAGAALGLAATVGLWLTADDQPDPWGE
jgi:hypothetical protein